MDNLCKSGNHATCSINLSVADIYVIIPVLHKFTENAKYAGHFFP
jgi:hypothetical protein